MSVRHFSCGKRQFKNQKAANRRKAELNESTEKNWRVYRCNKCGQYHLSTKSPGQVRKNLKRGYRKNLESIKRWLKKK